MLLIKHVIPTLLLLSAWNVTRGFTETSTCIPTGRPSFPVPTGDGKLQYSSVTGASKRPRTVLVIPGPYEVIFDYPPQCYMVVKEIKIESQGSCIFLIDTRERIDSKSPWTRWNPTHTTKSKQSSRSGGMVVDRVKLIISVQILKHQLNLRFTIAPVSCKVSLNGNEPYITVISEDIDECKNITTCSPSPRGTCTNTFGSYQCSCNAGYTNGSTCQDLDECSITPGVCQHITDSICKNSPGSYRCQCNPGHTGVTCQEDIDECSQHGTHNCTARLNGENRICENTNGSYRCPCASTGNTILDEHCAEKQDLASTGSATLPIAVGVPVLGLALTALLIWVIVRRRRKASLNVVGQDTETREMRAYENNQLSVMPRNERDVINVQDGVERREQVATHESATKEVVYSLPKKPKKPGTSNGESEEGSIIRNNRADNNDGTCGLYHLAT
eukprot:scpid81828/ scgid22741/ Latent-transforming growth factor beta-binding protein 4